MLDMAMQPAEPCGFAIFLADIGQQLHADANAKKRPPLAAHGFIQRIGKAGDAGQRLPAIAKRAIAGQDNAVCGADPIGIGRDVDRAAHANIVKCASKALFSRMQISGAVIDQCNPHQRPPGSGKLPSTAWVRAGHAGPVEGTMGSARDVPTFVA